MDGVPGGLPPAASARCPVSVGVCFCRRGQVFSLHVGYGWSTGCSQKGYVSAIGPVISICAVVTPGSGGGGPTGKSRRSVPVICDGDGNYVFTGSWSSGVRVRPSITPSIKGRLLVGLVSA